MKFQGETAAIIDQFLPWPLALCAAGRAIHVQLWPSTYGQVTWSLDRLKNLPALKVQSS